MCFSSVCKRSSCLASRTRRRVSRVTPPYSGLDFNVGAQMLCFTNFGAGVPLEWVMATAVPPHKSETRPCRNCCATMDQRLSKSVRHSSVSCELAICPLAFSQMALYLVPWLSWSQAFSTAVSVSGSWVEYLRARRSLSGSWVGRCSLQILLQSWAAESVMARAQCCGACTLLL